MKVTQSPKASGNGSHQVRPPCPETHASNPGVSEPVTVRVTAVQRASIAPAIDEHVSAGVEATHAYVRRYWIPIIGPGAVADLLRLTAAAKSGRSLPEPIHLSSLLRYGLAHQTRGTVVLPATVRTLDHDQVRRLPPALRRTHPSLMPA